MGKKGHRNKHHNKQSNSNASSSSRPQQRQPQQSDAAGSSAWSGRRAPPASRGDPDLSVAFSFVTEDLVNSILSRGVPSRLNSFDKLKTFLDTSFHGHPSLETFFAALAGGLRFGVSVINDPVPLTAQLSNSPMPLLLWVTQYRFLNNKLGCRLSHAVVDLVCRAGADIHHRLPNGTNALFFAVKYATLETVDYFLQKGVDVNQRDQFGRTCLYNALEHPDPPILRRLLQYLPATETIPSERPGGGGGSFQISLLDALLNFVTSMNPIISWVNLGEPRADDLLDALMLLRQGGARLTELGSGYSLKAMGFAFTTSDHPQIRNPKLLQDLAKALVGIKIPSDFRPNQEVSILGENIGSLSVEDEGNGKSSSTECPICLSDAKKAVKLYCGHTFCRSCIIDHGRSSLSDTGCPICRLRLCQDLCPNADRRKISVNDILGMGMAASGRRGPRFFTNEQVDAEARAQGIYSIFSSYAAMRSKLESSLELGRKVSQKVNPLNMSLNDSNQELSGNARALVELCNTVSITGGTPLSHLLMHPNNGPPSIDITIQGITLLARISNRSLYTVFSRDVVEQLGLKRIDKLTSSKFVDTLSGKKCRNLKFTCLEPVAITIGEGIEVTLHNAVEMTNSKFDMFGIQLGQDFLLSGLFCAIDVEIGSAGQYWRVVAEESWPISTPSSKTESLRYYSHDGKVADLPLMHFNPFECGTCLGISLREDVRFTECSWCCRVFPEGMLECSLCLEAGSRAYYCDERCQRAGWKIHRKTRQAHQAEEYID